MRPIVGYILSIALICAVSYAQKCENTLPQCDGATCGVNLNVRFDNKTTVCDCKMSDYDVHFTECANGKKSAFFFYKPPAVCLNGNLPSPIHNIDCDLPCTNGRYIDTNSTNCVACSPGAYSNPTKTTTYNHWTSIPPQFTTSCESTYPYPCSPWVVRGDWIDSGFNRFVHNLRSSLDYRFEVKTDTAKLSFNYQVSCEDRYDNLKFILDDQVLLTESIKTGYFEKNVSYGFHTAKWVYNKDSSLSGGEDIAKVYSINLEAPNTIAFACDKCKPGEASDGTTPCKKCEPGFYSDEEGSSSCTPCLPTYTSFKGATKCFPSNVPCTSSDYFEVRGACDESNRQTVSYEWIQPKLCNDTGTSGKPEAKTVACEQAKCAHGQQPDGSGKCAYCTVGKFSTDGKECKQCATGTAGSTKFVTHNDWTQWPSSAWKTGCDGDCSSNGWRLAGDYIDSGIGNGISSSYFSFPAPLVNDTNLPGRNRNITIEYALSCTDGSLQVDIDGSAYVSIPCAGCNDLSVTKKIYMYWLPSGNHKIGVTFRTDSINQNSNATVATCSQAQIRNISISGHASEGGAAECQSCSSGTFTVTQDKCESCEAGSSSGPLATQCEACPANTFAPMHSNKCYPCGSGFQSEQGSAQCEWSAGQCKYNWQNNRTNDFNDKQWLTTRYANLQEPGSEFYLNLCGLNSECNNIGALVCKYVPGTDDWINLGGSLSIQPKEEDGKFVMSMMATNYAARCAATNATDSPRGPINTLVKLVCEPDSNTMAQGTVRSLGPCDYEYVIGTNLACPLCTQDDYEAVVGSCDPVTRLAPVKYIKNTTFDGLTLSGAGHCSGGVDKTGLVEYVPCTIPLPVPYWIPLAVVGGFLALLVAAVIVIIVLYKKFRDVRRKYDQFIDEDENGVPRPKNSTIDLQTPASINISAD